jgi:TonB-dependent starch-binding outer membrane protein SusC
MLKPHYRLFLFYLWLLFFRLITAQAQVPPFSIKGGVREEMTGEMLVGVNVYFKNTNIGTVTDSNGEFFLSVKPGKDTLVISCIGYETKEIIINPARNQAINIVLAPAEIKIGEVKITTQRKFFGNMVYGRDIPLIDAKEIEKQFTSNASDILHARVAGVWATKTSGAPGDHQKIRIRGQNSIFSSAEPLYVVDGVPVPIVNLSSLGIADLNVHDIQSVTVLKDASSSALYGFQGGNGVILIDTKQGGKNEINFTSNAGVQWFDNYYDYMSSKDFIATLDLAYNNLNVELKDSYPAYTDSICSKDWQREIFSAGFTNEFQLSASGNQNKLRYYFSGSYLAQEGIIPISKYRRYTFLTRLNREFFKKVAIGITYRGSFQENLNNQDEYNGNRLLFEGINKPPCIECIPDSLNYDENSSQPRPRAYIFDYVPLNDFETPESIIKNNNRELKLYSHNVSGFARWQIAEHLSMDFMESMMIKHSIYNSAFDYYNAFLWKDSANFKSSENVMLFNHQASITYNNSFGKHEVGLVLAYRFYKDNLWWEVDSMNNTLPEHYYLKNSMASYGLKGSVLRSLNSYIGNLSYNYNKTFFLSVVANISQVKEGLHTNYYTLFPSVAVSWEIIQEKHLKEIRWLNHLNVYINWGQSGNYPLNGLSNDFHEDVPYTDTATFHYPAVSQFANHSLTHENTAETDIGIKSSFFNRRLNINASYFVKSISNQIIMRDIPYYYGGGKMYLNIGRIAVTGMELGIESIPVQTHNFTWFLKFNFSTTEDKVKKLANGEPLLFRDNDLLIPDFLIKEGDPLGNIYGYQCLGKWTPADDANKNNKYIKSHGLKYLNADSSDKILNSSDKVVIGNSIPDYTWNLSNYFQYGNFSLDLSWYAVWGVDKYNASRAAGYMTNNNREVTSYIADSILLTKTFFESSAFIDDASFIRLKTITLGYEPDKKLFNRIGWKFSLTLENMMTFTHYRGYDPEATIFTDNNFSDNAVDRGAYPNPKGFFASFSLTF